jgi:glycosyltransferase involved in cell wall biosynthesis
VRALYISHNGMLEGLGHGQVLPYLRGLARRGVSIDLLSYEAQGTEPAAVETLRDSLAASGIRWTALPRRRDTRLVVKVAESATGALHALATALRRRPDIVHGRSYLPTAVADVVASLIPRARLVFDCRGMVGDEYVDARHWSQDRLEYKLVKRYEARAFHRAEGVVVLTEALKRWITARRWFGPETHVEAIPCCVDLDTFKFDEGARVRLRRELGVEDKLVVLYSGSLGSWYREEDLARFAGILRKRTGRPVAFVLLTRAPPDELVGLLKREGLTDEEIIVRGVKPPEMPAYLSLGDIGLSFIKSCFSKKGSSPTKVAEYLACGLPVVLNGDIGDQVDLSEEEDACVVVESFADDELVRAADAALVLAARPIAERVRVGRHVADHRFGLERVGVARYERLYRAVVGVR